jgi:hypothetical protein
MATKTTGKTKAAPVKQVGKGASKAAPKKAVRKATSTSASRKSDSSAVLNELKGLARQLKDAAKGLNKKAAQNPRDVSAILGSVERMTGAMYRARTRDHWNHNPMLYQLS